MDQGLEARQAVDMRAFGYLIRDYWKKIVLVTLLPVGVSVTFTAHAGLPRGDPRHAREAEFRQRRAGRR
jgi:hypothetical protein